MKKGKSGIKYLIGVDEAGRGPLAGPVTAAAAVLPARRRPIWLKKIKNSKALSPKKRNWWLFEARRRKILLAVSSVSAVTIDRVGIAAAVRLAVKRSLRKLKINPAKAKVLLDGGMKAPREFYHQKTIIRGDERIPIIALASIAAKVCRDNKMVRLDRRFPGYFLAEHKGYGTPRHHWTIKHLGPSSIHRRTFLKNHYRV